MATSTQKTRRVSFDLGLNTIHLLPTDKQVKEHADKLRREAYQNRTLLQELLDDSIVSEIVAACHWSSPSYDACLKSCLKQQPLLATKKNKKSRNQVVAPTRRPHTTKNDELRKSIGAY
ncbi:hypothetical protein BC941DRAFT_500776 [Chlamydoabsidia padenii]|nr:hypothetical protein BC941DRAFT_500776 [Chlamydoabsidia padenii]